MAAVAKSGIPSIATTDLPSNCQMTLPCGQAIEAGEIIYVKSDGKLWLASGAAADALAQWWGIASHRQSVVGDPVTAHKDCIYHYGSGMTPGTRFFLSATVPGGLDTTASTGTPAGQPVAFAYNATCIYVFNPVR